VIGRRNLFFLPLSSVSLSRGWSGLPFSFFLVFFPLFDLVMTAYFADYRQLCRARWNGHRRLNGCQPRGASPLRAGADGHSPTRGTPVRRNENASKTQHLQLHWPCHTTSPLHIHKPDPTQEFDPDSLLVIHDPLVVQQPAQGGAANPGASNRQQK